MVNDPELAELEKIFCAMDKEGKEKIIAAAAKLLDVQKTLDNSQLMFQNSNQALIQEKTAKTTLFGREFQTFQLAGYFATGLLLIVTACFFWITSINPALQINNNNPLLMVRIMVTAIFGFFCIGTGIVLFILRKITFIWSFLTISAGILCAIPDIAFDFIGLILIALIAFAQLIKVKQNKARVAV